MRAEALVDAVHRADRPEHRDGLQAVEVARLVARDGDPDGPVVDPLAGPDEEELAT